MNKNIEYLYKCYLGPSVAYRALTIYRFVTEYGAEEFFKKYSTEKDSICQFIQKCKDKGFIE